MEKYELTSVFADEILNYANEKTLAGYKGEALKKHLYPFDRFCAEENLVEPVFTSEHAAKWITKHENESHSYHYSRINASKKFVEYLCLKGYDVYIFRNVSFKGTDFSPHIYTDKEVEAYFLAVDTFTNPKNKKDAIQYPVLFRILYCCGTRINETLGIRKKDVDLDKGIICLNETKNNNQRYVVMGDDLRELFNEFANKCFYLLDDDDYVFTSGRNNRLSADAVYDRHREFLKKAGITYVGNNEGPRIHDWRHHMAVYSFKKLADSGMDMYVALPILSAYLGHKNIYSTEHYVRLTLQLFPYIEEKFGSIVNLIFSDSQKEYESDEE